MRSSPFSLSRPREVIIERVIALEEQGQRFEFPWRVRKLLPVDMFTIHQRTHELVARFVGTDEYEPEEELPPVGGEPCTITAGACSFVATLLTAQVEESENYKPWIAAEVIAMLVSPQVTVELQKLSMEIAIDIEQGGRKSDPLASTGSTSPGISSSGESDTQP